MRTVMFLFLSAMLAQPLWAADSRQIAVLDTELIIDMKRRPHDPDPEAETRRARYLSAQVRKALEMSDHYEVVSTSKAEETVKELESSHRYLHQCNNCEIRIGKELGTDLVANLWVQKVSNLIINLNMVIKDVKTGEAIMTTFVDIRGNTDGSWMNGTTYLLEKFFREYHETVPADLEQAEAVWPTNT